jgi:ribonuclease P protein component
VVNSFPKSLRLRKSAEYKTLKKHKSFFEGKALFIEYMVQKDLRLGLSISKSYGNAVKRGALKRKIREVFRTTKGIKHLWLNVKPKLGIEPTFGDVKKDFEDFTNVYHHLSSSQGKSQEVHAHSH